MQRHRFARGRVILCSLALLCVAWLIQFALTLHAYGTASGRLGEILSYGRRICAMALPLLAVGYVALVICNIVLVKRHDYRIGNMLSVLLPCLVAIGVIAIVALPDWATVTGIIIFATLQDICGYLASYLLCFLVATAICATSATRPSAKYGKDFIIILGCRVFEDGRPSQILCRRLDRAIKFERRQYRATGKHATFIVSGAKGWGEATSEAKCMRDYLLAHKVSPERIIVENQAKTTCQNMINSKRIIDQKHPGAKVAFCTTNYHLYRAGILAHDAGFMRIDGIGAKTSWDYYLNAILREFIGMLDVAKRQHALIVAAMIVFVIVGHLCI